MRLVMVAALVVACTPTRRSEAPLPPHDPTRISHGQHAKIVECTSCHTQSGRPGADDHAPCANSGCHEDAFLAAPGKVCDVCHDPIRTQPLRAPLKPYPAQGGWRSLPSRFSHQLHLDADRVEDRVGFHVTCADCHVRDGQLVAPDHATCARCHAAEVGLANAPVMDEPAHCGNCHQAGDRPRTRQRLIKDDLEFSHARHRTDLKNQAIRCETCHERTSASRGYGDHAAPRVESCVGCHDDRARTPYAMRMRVCETCHSARRASLTVIAPRNHLTASERPLDHTIAFRRDHADVAAREATRCATCHVQMSGNGRQACDECHQTMLPSDHRITWRELDHGAEAAADRNRCATCHVVEFCTACHAQRPRSHGLVGTFTTTHGQLARINVRPCMTCHMADYSGPDATGVIRCNDCHEVGGMPPRGMP